MEFGIALPTAADSWRVVEKAESLGFEHAWFYDTQMLSADCFVGDVPTGVEAMGDMQAKWREAGRDPEALGA